MKTQIAPVIQSRQYQIRAAQECLSWLRAGRATLLVSPTGAGKTRMAAMIARRYKRVLLVAHRQEIISQAESAIPNVTAMSIQAALRYGPKRTDLLIIDEAHRSAAGTYRALIEKYSRAARLGLTATPVRVDGQGLCDAFDEMVVASNIADLTVDGYLVPYRALEAPDEALKQLAHMRRASGDWKTGELNDLVNTPRLVGNVVREYQKHGEGRKTVVFAVSVDHSRKLTRAFQDAGIRAVHIDGQASSRLRAEALQSLADGRVDVLCNVNLFTEGWDCPAVSCVIMARPTASMTLYLQSVGRGMRKHSGKSDLLVLDHAGNIERHGPPDMPRSWSLESDAQKAKREKEVAELERLAALGFDSIEAELEERHRFLNDTYSATQCAKMLAIRGYGAISYLTARGIRGVKTTGQVRYRRSDIDGLSLAISNSYGTKKVAELLGVTSVGAFCRLRGIYPMPGFRGLYTRYEKGAIDRACLSLGDRYSRGEAANVLGVSISCVLKVLRIRGVKPTSGPRGSGFLKEQVDAVAARRGIPLKEVAKMLGISVYRAKNALRDAGISPVKASGIDRPNWIYFAPADVALLKARLCA